MPDSNAKKLAQFLTSSGTYNLYDVQADSTGFFDLPNGTTAQRPSPTAGMIRFNSTFNLAEYYTGTEWKAVDTPPQITGVSPSNFDTSGTTITVTGSNFQSGITAKLQGNDGTNYNAATTTRVSSSEVTFDVTAAMVTDNDPFKVILTNTSGLSGEYESVYYATDPVWTTSAGSLGTYYNYNRTGLSYTVAATSSDANDTITYAITSGSLPSGLSLNTSTGAITGDAAEVGSSTTYTFEITATATGEGSTTNTTARTFTLTNGAYVVTSYTSVGSGTFSVPSGISAVNVLVVAGGGGSGSTNGGGGGAGGLVYATSYPVTPGGSVSYTVGGGGNGATTRSGSAPDSTSRGQTGQNSVFGQLTANGGGGGGSRGDGPVSYAGEVGNPGGSGGGGSSADNPGQNQPGGSANQPGNGGHPTGQGYGNAGGSGGVRSPHNAGGGGGAGAAGDPAQQNVKRYGGVGRQYDIGGQGQVYYAGGGAGFGGSGPQIAQWNEGGQGGGGNAVFSGNVMELPQGRDFINGTANRGGGGGGIGTNVPEASAPATQNGTGGHGGSGIVIVSY